MVEQDSQKIIATLEKAGAGISITKRIAGKHLIFPLLNRFISWDKAWDIYEREG